MILTDTDIQQQVRLRNIEITDFDPKKLGSNSYDLSLGKDLLVYVNETLDAKQDNPYSRFEIPEEGFVLMPGQLYLGVTKERTCTRLHTPMIEGKSSIGRLGISIHITAGFGDIGFNGHWTLEITAVKPVRIYADMPIAQIWFLLPLGNCTNPYSEKKSAKYKDQPAVPMPSAMWRNFIPEKELV